MMNDNLISVHVPSVFEPRNRIAYKEFVDVHQYNIK